MKNKTFTIYRRKPTIEGAGVKLFRLFGFSEIPQFDPFLMFDHFGSQNPEDYIKGFPWHPHRGIETVTYVLNGEVEHADSLGNKGTIKSGDVQWMTAGSGIIHQEMPKKSIHGMDGFQLWINLPRKKKMINPKYRDIKSSEIPVLESNDFSLKLISGTFKEVIGPVSDLAVDIDYFDIELKPNKKIQLALKKNHTTFIYLIKGTALIDDIIIQEGNCVLFLRGDIAEIIAKDKLHFLFISGKKLNEPISWGGPIVMNSNEELQKAFEEFNNGSFVKH